MTQAVVRVRGHQLDALEATLDEALQEARPERLGFRGTKAEADDLAPAISIDCHGDYPSQCQTNLAERLIAATETMRPPSRIFK